MSNTATIVVTSDRTSGSLSDIFIDSNKELAMKNISNWVTGLSAGCDAASLSIKINTGNAVTASKTVTISSPITNDSLEINGVAFVAGSDWAIGGSNTISATNLTAAINASGNALISGLVSASSDGATITISAVTPGLAGNMITLEGKGSGGVDPAGSGVHASGTLTLSSLAANDTAVINGVTLTAVDKKEKWQITAIAELGKKEVSTITTAAEAGVKEVSTITTGPDVAGSLNSTYFTFKAKDTGGATETGYYVWYNINGAGVDPVVASHTAIPVAGATNVTANDLATATRSAITSVAGSKVVVTGATDQVVITSRYMGNATAAADGAAPTGFTIATSTGGVASNLLSKYITFKAKDTGGATETGYYIWFNTNSEGVDPAPASHTAIPVVVAIGDSANTIGTATRAAVTSVAGSKVTVSGATDQVVITGNYMGNATNIADTGSTGLTVATTTAGVASNLLNTYFTLYSAADATKYGIWCNVNGEGVAPSISGVSAGNRVAAVIEALDSANNVAAALRLPFTTTPLSTSFTESGATDKCIFRTVAVGTTTDSADTGSTGFTFANVVQGGSVSATQFQIGASNSADATSLAALINAQATLTPIVVGTAASAVVTVTATEEGVEGNNITLSGTGGATASAARLASGTDSGIVRLASGSNDSGATVYNVGR